MSSTGRLLTSTPHLSDPKCKLGSVAYGRRILCALRMNISELVSRQVQSLDASMDLQVLNLAMAPNWTSPHAVILRST